MSAATPARWFCAVAEAFQSAELLCRLYRTGGGQVEHTFINEGHESCGARRLVDPSALVVERDAEALHDLIADALWEYAEGDSLEGPCEFADAVLFALGVTEKGCGPNGHITPFPHPNVFFDALAARREAST